MPKLDEMTLDDLRNVDEDRLSIGTDYQDCALIAQAFERACYSTPTEAATLAPLNRSLENTQAFAKTVQNNFQTYLTSPPPEDSEEGTAAQTDASLQALNVGKTTLATQGNESFGKSLLDRLKECIPCSIRLVSYLELHPDLNLMGTLKADILNRLKMLRALAEQLKDLSVYGDFCDLLKFLSFMCIPDLQRIIAMLMALLMLQLPTLDGIVSMLQSLIAPIFAPIFMGLTTLLDQFNVLVANPLKCIIDAIDEQLKKVDLEIDPKRKEQLAAVSNGLIYLKQQLVEARQKVQAKVDMYMKQIKVMLGELNFGDAAHINFSFQKLQIIRMIGFVTSIIKGLSTGHLACVSDGKTPQKSELDDFFNNFLNPNQAFQMYLDEAGNLHVDEKVPGFDDVNLPNYSNVITINGEDLLTEPSPVSDIVLETANLLNKPTEVVLRCNVKTTFENADLVNDWIAELNNL